MRRSLLRRAGLGPSLALAALAAACGGDAPGAERAAAAGERGPAPPPPSLVLVSLDTLAARHTSLHGYPRPTTPRLEAFAERATVFEEAWANAPWTTPSYLSQMTGLLPLAHRVPEGAEVAEDGPAGRWRLADEHVTLAELLRAAGLRTAAFVDNPNAAGALGLAQGFEVYDESAAAIPKTDHAGGLRKVAADGLAWLDGLGDDEPFFLFLQALDAHAPYAPRPEWLAALEPAPEPEVPSDAAEAPVAADHGPIFDAVPRHVADALEEPGPRVATAPIVDAYDAEVLGLDLALGELLDALQARGVLERAVVVVTADHGESLVEHHSLFSHDVPFEEVAHVPLVVQLPGQREGRRVDVPVQLVDLYPTLAELVGAPFDPGALHGRSLVPLLEGGTLPPRPLVVQGDLLEARAIRQGDWKLVRLHLDPATAGPEVLLSRPRVRAWLAERHPELEDLVPGTVELPLEALAGVDLEALWAEAEDELGGTWDRLYRLDRDPAEARDLAAAHPDRAAALAELLEAAEAAARSARVDGPAEGAALPPELAEQLRALGYAR